MLARIITELQSLGLRGPRNGLERRGGAGPAEGGVLFMGGLTVNLPTQSPFVQYSPYYLKAEGEDLWLMKGGNALLPVKTLPSPSFYQAATKDGVPYRKIALLHGADCLATTVRQKCVFWPTPGRCRFCGIELSLAGGRTMAVKSPDQVAEVAAHAKKLDGIRHVVLTTGTASPPGAENRLLMACARAIKEASDLPVHVQCLPLLDLDDMTRLKQAGVDTIGIHIESMDQKALAKAAPPKAALGLPRFIRAWKKAVEVFGPNQVSSFLLAGLGEAPGSLLKGAELLADLGVYPFLVPLRPIPGSLMENVPPPDSKTMMGLYEEVAAMLARKGLSSSKSLAGCVRCGACSALAAYEEGPAEVVCHAVRTAGEMAQAREVRRRVFVEEQGMNAASELDSDDPRSIHLVACLGDKIVGTVRIFPVSDTNGHWVGGRLAVDKAYRAKGAAELLVREAVAAAARRGCRKFTASIQKKNVPFFKRLGWQPSGGPNFHHGIEHQPMQADLDRV